MIKCDVMYGPFRDISSKMCDALVLERILTSDYY